MNSQEVLGVDIGGVIIDRVNDDSDTSFFADGYLESTAVVGAFAALARLNAERFHGEIYLVSKCGRRIEARTREWLRHHGFWEAVGLPDDQVRFCRRREEKALIAADLGITHFIDDRLEVLSYLTGVPHRYLFNPGRQRDRPVPPPPAEGQARRQLASGARRVAAVTLADLL